MHEAIYDGTLVDRVRVRCLPDGRLTRTDAGKYLGVSSKTLAMWQGNGKGPRSVKVGGRVFYYQKDLDRFITDGHPSPKAA